MSIADADDEQAILERTLQVAHELTGATSGRAHLIGSDSAIAVEVVEGPPDLPTRLEKVIETVLAGRSVRSNRSRGHRTTPDGPAIIGVPITAGGKVLGGLYLQRSPGRAPFSAQHQVLIEALAQQCATAVARLRAGRATDELLAGLHLTDQRADDRPTLPGEPSAVIRRLLSTARGVLGMELAFLSRIADGVQTFAAVDAGGSAPSPAEGSTNEAADGYCTLLLNGAIPPAVPDVASHPVLAAMPVTTELGIGAYCGVPVRLPDGSLYGTLCGLHPDSITAPSSAQLEALAVVARLVGHSLAAEQRLSREREADRQAFRTLVDGQGRSIALQPIVDLSDGRAVGYEALSRFVDGDGSPRRPDEVFAKAAALGLLLYLEQAAARSALSLLPQLPGDTYLSINLSPAALLDPVTQDLLRSCAPGRLVVEVTEHEEVGDYPAIRQAIADLRARGLRLAIDDTGAGFASLQHLTQLTPDIIKLDVAFVRDVQADPACRAVARAIAGYAAEVGATLVAEGIELPEQATTLRGLGASYGQGYHFSRPQPPERLFSAAPHPTGSVRKAVA
ncbi:EAL domain, c-di-GMP-specific phosphodiesterase class I (or its enzymatically inactive variant) [Blastococcus tunisiensis]|uniref:EAL domain, c-di-GMP-specific phosphodiesterase class I (Or its enzymatically inactive variant) n=1 Tax=Blastococcus tunisiensis TaxID=1798228 RepID=A0A1I2EKC1_9ACTN|nr:EAL domain, c-di-GMP-specific phosphodiesterase class I (or its enzymatically inactive variant) [Blastococcus sp. DSM 46838]